MCGSNYWTPSNSCFGKPLYSQPGELSAAHRVLIIDPSTRPVGSSDSGVPMKLEAFDQADSVARAGAAVIALDARRPSPRVAALR
jgi:hypothetical protein